MRLDVNNPRHYDIATALRGPDAPGNVGTLVKQLTTAVLRYQVGLRNKYVLVDTHPQTVAKDMWASASPRQKGAARRFWDRQDHFRNHFLIAARKLPKMGDYLRWLEGELRDGM